MLDQLADKVLEAHSLSKEVSSPEGTLTILNDVSFNIVAGETVAVVGASGAGKSTLLRLIAGLEEAWTFFDGVTTRVVLDNLKAAIIRACWNDPQVQQAYRECAEHYGFLIAPCRPYTPEHKGKVEQGGVHYVKRNFLGGRTATSILQANQDVLVWCETTAGLRIHGTTKEQPLRRFQETEQERLHPLPKTPYDLAIWKAKLKELRTI